jgi:hypothetical protein
MGFDLIGRRWGCANGPTGMFWQPTGKFSTDEGRKDLRWMSNRFSSDRLRADGRSKYVCTSRLKERCETVFFSRSFQTDGRSIGVSGRRTTNERASRLAKL